jgi:hypothetical protein
MAADTFASTTADKPSIATIDMPPKLSIARPVPRSEVRHRSPTITAPTNEIRPAEKCDDGEFGCLT